MRWRRRGAEGRRPGDGERAARGSHRPSRAARESAVGPRRPDRGEPGVKPPSPRACGRPRRAGGALLLRRPSSEPARRPGSAPVAPTPRAGGGGGGGGELGLPEPADGEPEQEQASGGGGRPAAPRCKGSKHLRALRAGLPLAGLPPGSLGPRSQRLKS